MKRNAFFLLILWVLLSTGCSGSSSGPAAGQPQTVKISVLLPVTGNSPINGTAQKAAVELAVEDINAYLTGINSSTRIEAVIEDTQGSIDEESRLLDYVRDHGSPIAVCSMTSESLSLLKSQIDDNGTIILNEVSTSPHLSIDDNLFRLVPDDKHTARVMADLLWEKSIEKVIFYYRDDWWGMALKEELTTAFIAKGGTVADSIVYSSRAYTATDDMDEKVAQLNASVTQILQVTASSKVAVILISFEEGIDILKKSSDYPALSTLKWYTGDGLGQNGDLLNDATAAAFARQVGLYAPLIAEVDSPAYQNLKTRIQDRTGLPLYSFAPVIYDAVWLAALTLAEGGSTAQLKTTLLAKAQTYTAVSAVSGKIGFNSTGDRSTCAYDFWKVDSVGNTYQWVKEVAAYSAIPAAKPRLSASKSVAPAGATKLTVARRYDPPPVLSEPTEAEFMKMMKQEQSEQRR
jgi:ABC-type branched-subunit amino acid transport system substrate-binding protein